MSAYFVAFCSLTTGGAEVSYQSSVEGVAAVVVFLATLLHVVVFALTISPLLAVTGRRFHDTGRPGPRFFLWFIPLVGWIIVLIMLAMPSRPQARRPEWDDPQDENPERRPAGAPDLDSRPQLLRRSR